MQNAEAGKKRLERCPQNNREQRFLEPEWCNEQALVKAKHSPRLGQGLLMKINECSLAAAAGASVVNELSAKMQDFTFSSASKLRPRADVAKRSSIWKRRCNKQRMSLPAKYKQQVEESTITCIVKWLTVSSNSKQILTLTDSRMTSLSTKGGCGVLLAMVLSAKNTLKST